MDRVGRFQIIKELGRGAMGVVYQAIDPTIGRSVAIKTIRLREVDDSEQRSRLRERLFREARSAGVLSHPNIVTIYDMDEEDGLAYIAMQFVNGPTVEALLDGPETALPKPLAPEQIFQILRQTASALDFAHSKGIVHRDIKPANIMIDDDDSVKIADFGIAKASASGNLTASGTILGTPNYMSPEQVQGTAIDGRSDQFSLGVVAYEIMTGARPFGGENLGTIVYRIVAEPAVEPAQINPALGEAIGRVLQKALQKNPKRRFLSCTEFVNELVAACAATPGWHGMARVHGIPIDSVSPPTTVPPKRAKRRTTAATSPVEVPPPAPEMLPVMRKPPSIVAPAVGAFAVVLGVLGLVAWQTNVPAEAPAQARAPKLEAPVPDVEIPPAPEVVVNPFANAGQGVRVDSETDPKQESVPVAKTSAVPDRSPGSFPVRSRSSLQPLHARATPMARAGSTLVAKAGPKRSRFGVSALPASVVTPVRLPDVPLQDIWVVTSPAGATATLDGHTESACQTPCMLLSGPGVHILFLSLRDFQPERRQLRIVDAREDVPLIALRPIGGTLMLSTVPSGANIFLNDRMLAELTPAQIPLQPGRYTVGVERDGTRKSQEIVVKNGATNFLRIPLED